MRFLACSLLLLLVGCAPKPQATAPRPPLKTDTEFDGVAARKALQAQADEVGKAGVDEDHARMADLTHPALVEKFGGRAAFIQKLEAIAAEMKGRGFRITKYTFGEPSQPLQAGGELYAVVPMEVELSGPRGAVGRQPSYLIAVSRNGGSEWTFLDGSGVGADRGKLKQLIPQFPDQLSLPAPQPAVWDRK